MSSNEYRRLDGLAHQPSVPSHTAPTSSPTSQIHISREFHVSYTHNDAEHPISEPNITHIRSGWEYTNITHNEHCPPAFNPRPTSNVSTETHISSRPPNRSKLSRVFSCFTASKPEGNEDRRRRSSKTSRPVAEQTITRTLNGIRCRRVSFPLSMLTSSTNPVVRPLIRSWLNEEPEAVVDPVLRSESATSSVVADEAVVEEDEPEDTRNSYGWRRLARYQRPRHDSENSAASVDYGALGPLVLARDHPALAGSENAHAGPVNPSGSNTPLTVRNNTVPQDSEPGLEGYWTPRRSSTVSTYFDYIEARQRGEDVELRPPPPAPKPKLKRHNYLPQRRTLALRTKRVWERKKQAARDGAVSTIEEASQESGSVRRGSTSGSDGGVLSFVTEALFSKREFSKEKREQLRRRRLRMAGYVVGQKRDSERQGGAVASSSSDSDEAGRGNAMDFRTMDDRGAAESRGPVPRERLSRIARPLETPAMTPSAVVGRPRRSLRRVSAHAESSGPADAASGLGSRQPASNGPESSPERFRRLMDDWKGRDGANNRDSGSGPAEK